MAYVAPREKFTMLSNALSGVTKGLNDVATMKLERDKMAQQQQQFDANLDLGFQRLDEQIRKADMDDATRKEINELRLAAEEKLTGKRLESAEKRTRMQAAVQYSRQRKEQEWRDYESEQKNARSTAIYNFVDTLEPLPAAPDPNDLEMFPQGANDMRYMSAVAMFNDAASFQTEQLAKSLAGFDGQVTPEMRRQANDIIMNKEMYKQRVVDSVQKMSTAKAQQAARNASFRASSGSYASLLPDLAGKSPEESFGGWKATDGMMSGKVYGYKIMGSEGKEVTAYTGVPDPRLLTTKESGLSAIQASFSESYVQKPNANLVAKRIADDIRNLPVMSQPAANDLFSKYISALSSSEEALRSGGDRSIVETRRNVLKFAEEFDSKMGYSGNVSDFTRMRLDFESMDMSGSLPDKLNLQPGMTAGQLYKGKGSTLGEIFLEASEELRGQNISVDPDDEIRGVTSLIPNGVDPSGDMFGEAFTLSPEQQLFRTGAGSQVPQVNAADMQAINAEIRRLESVYGTLSVTQRGDVMKKYFGMK